jgi:hypothetical protein
MDFGRVLETVAGFLEEKDFRYAVVGGFALAAYGLPRTTLDLDFVVESAIQENLIQFLLKLPGVDRHKAESYFDRQGLGDRLDEIKRTL